MSDTTARAAVVTFFKNANITGLEQVYRDMPWFIDGSKWGMALNNGWGAICYVHIDQTQESRITFLGADLLGAPTGQKQIDMTVSLIVAYQFLIPTKGTDDVVEDMWVSPLDELLDAMRALLRSDPTLGTGAESAMADAPVFQAGQGENDIRQTRDLPRLDLLNGRVVSWNRIEFDLTQIITA